MKTNACVKDIISNSYGDEIITCNSQDYYNESNPKYKEVIDIVKENGKLIILTK